MIKTIKTALFMFSGLLVTFNISSQTNMIQGYVYDKETNSPLPYAHVTIKNTTMGTITNRDGFFRYNLPKDIYFPVDVEVSFVSYLSRQFTISSSKPVYLYLKQDKVLLSEVVIEEDFIYGILEAAYNRIPKNYPAKGSRYKGFFRQTVYHKDTVVYMGEAFMDAYKSSYKRDSRDDQIELLKFRKFTVEPNYADSLRLYGGPFITYSTDFVKLRASFLNPDNYNSFDYEYNKVVNFQNEEHFKINFKYKSAPVSGSMLINKNNFAYSNIIFESNQDSIVEGGLYRGPSMANVIYYRSGDVYFLKNFDFTLNAISISTEMHLLINGIYTVTKANLKDASPIDYRKTMPYRDIFMDSTVDTSKAFWDNYNIIENDSLMNRFIAHSVSQSIKSIDKDIGSLITHAGNQSGSSSFLRWLGFISKIDFEWGCGVQWFNSSLYPEKIVAANDNLSDEAELEYIDKPPFFHGYFSFSYSFSRVSFLSFTTSTVKPFSDSYRSINLSYLYRNRIKHYGRPMFLDTGAGFSYFSHKRNPKLPPGNELLINENLDFVGITGSLFNVNARLTVFPLRSLALIINARLGYLMDYKYVYNYNPSNVQTDYMLINGRSICFSERLQPSVTLGLKYYIMGGF